MVNNVEARQLVLFKRRLLRGENNEIIKSHKKINLRRDLLNKPHFLYGLRADLCAPVLTTWLSEMDTFHITESYNIINLLALLSQWPTPSTTLI